MPYDPRAPMQAPVTQFPAVPLMDAQSLAMIQRRMLGGPPQGLLDTSNAPAGLLGPPTAQRPGGLLAPIVWDRLMRGISPMLGTEGGARGSYAQGGGGRGFEPTNQYPLDLRGGRGEAPKPPPWKPDWERGEYGDEHVAMTPSGVQVTIMDRGNGTVDAMFAEPGRSMRSSYLTGSGENSTGRSIDRFGEVFSAIKDYVQSFRPERLTFSSASDSHERLYNRVAPLMAKELGGRLARASGGSYAIDLVGPNTEPR